MTIEKERYDYKKNIEKDSTKLESLIKKNLYLTNSMKEKLWYLNKLDKYLFIEKNFKDNRSNDLTKLENALIKKIQDNIKQTNKIELLKNCEKLWW